MNEEHPQIKVFREAAEAMKQERYWSYSNVEDKLEFLNALSDVLREVCYHLDSDKVLPPEAMEAYRSAAQMRFPAAFQTSAELILTSSMQTHIEECRKNHRADLDHVYALDFDDPEVRRLANGGHDSQTDGPL